MTRADSHVPHGAGANFPTDGIPFPAMLEPFAGWLALADPDGPIDLPRLFPDVAVRVELTSVGFADALANAEPNLIVLIAPPAGPGDLQRVGAAFV